MLHYNWQSKYRAELLADQQIRPNPRSKDVLKRYYSTVEKNNNQSARLFGIRADVINNDSNVNNNNNDYNNSI